MRARSSSSSLALTVLALAQPALAQEGGSPARLNRFAPGPGPDALISMHGVTTNDGVQVAAMADVAARPLSVYVQTEQGESVRTDVVGRQSALHLTLDATLVDGFNAFAMLPVNLELNGEQDESLGVGPGQPGLGDAVVGLRARFWETPTGALVGASGAVSLPSSTGGPWTGDHEFGAEGRLAVVVPIDRIDLLGNVGLRSRPPRDIVNHAVGSEGFGGVGARVHVLDPLNVEAEVVAATTIDRGSAFGRDSTYAEALGALEWLPSRHVALNGGLGVGLADGVGTPQLRLIFGLEVHRDWRPTRPAPVSAVAEPAAPASAVGPVDTDGDGLVDSKDRCRLQPEDFDGNSDWDGCPDADAPESGVVVEVQTEESPPALDLSRVHFDTGSWTIKPEYEPYVAQAAEYLKKHPEIGTVVVQGHTDTHGAEEDNAVLSQKRALAVVALLTRMGVDSARLHAVGYGETQPDAEEGTALGRARNRRAVVVPLSPPTPTQEEP